MSFDLPRRQYADLYGPTTGDAIRLADTDLFLEIEKDLTVHGEEVVFGGGKVIRDGMGQNGQLPRDGDGQDGAVPDTVITNVVILDYTGIYKADVALRDGHIFRIGKAGNPQITDGVDIVIGASTEIFSSSMFASDGKTRVKATVSPVSKSRISAREFIVITSLNTSFGSTMTARSSSSVRAFRSPCLRGSEASTSISKSSRRWLSWLVT